MEKGIMTCVLCTKELGTVVAEKIEECIMPSMLCECGGEILLTKANG